MQRQKSLGRGLEEISNQFLSTPDEESQLEQLASRLERLEYELGVSKSHTAAVSRDAQTAVSPEFYQFDEVISGLKNNLSRDYRAAGIFGSDGISLVFDSISEKLNREAASAYFAESMNNTGEITAELKLGTLRSLMVTSQYYHIFIHCLSGDRKYFLCLIMKNGGNIGKAMLMLNEVSSKLSFT